MGPPACSVSSLLFIYGVLLAWFVVEGSAISVDLADTLQVSGASVLIVSTSRYWFNYRHSANALGVYSAVRRLGVQDDRIVLMLADDHAHSAKNPFRGTLYGLDEDRESATSDFHPHTTEVDYIGAAVTPAAVYRVLNGRHLPGTPAHRMLPGGPNSSLLVYMTGHGGDGFLKFHDKTEMAAEDFAHALEEGRASGRWGEALLLFDTCQAATLTEALRSPGLIALVSSVRGENSYAHGHDRSVGQSLMDGFTHTVTSFLREGLDDAGGAVYAAAAALAQEVETAPMEYPDGSSIDLDADSLGLPERGGAGRVLSRRRPLLDACDSDPQPAALARACKVARKERRRVLPLSPGKRPSGVSCASFQPVFPAFASLARSAEASLAQLRALPSESLTGAPSDMRAACVRAALDLIRLHRKHGTGGPEESEASQQHPDARLAAVLRNALFTNTAQAGQSGGAGSGEKPTGRGAGAAVMGASWSSLPRPGALTLGALFRSSPRWRTASTTYARLDLARPSRIEEAAATVYGTGASHLASGPATVGTLAPVLQDPQAFAHEGAAAADERGSLVLLDGISLLQFFFAGEGL